MRNWKVALLMFTLYALVAAGCGTPFASEDARGASGESREESLPFQQESPQSLPDEVKQKQAEVRQVGGNGIYHTEVRSGDRIYLILSLGQRPTGGYSIRVNEVVRKGNTVRINAEEVPPSKNTFTTQAISRPNTVISLKQPKGEVQFNYQIRQTEPKKHSHKSPSSPSTVDDPNIQKLDAHPEPHLSTLPDPVKQKVEEVCSRTQGGEAVIHHGGKTYLIIALGLRRSGGYGISLEGIHQRNREIHVYARETVPAPGSVSISALTYPVRVFSLEKPNEQADISFHVQTKASPPGGKETR